MYCKTSYEERAIRVSPKTRQQRRSYIWPALPVGAKGISSLHMSPSALITSMTKLLDASDIVILGEKFRYLGRAP